MLTGVADRVDGWEHDGKLYLRIVDYKSGAKQFSLTDVWYGMGLQMLLYLFTLEKTGLQGRDIPIVPAGVLYVPARDTLISAGERLSDEEILKEKLKKLRRSGLLLKDETVLEAMERGDLYASCGPEIKSLTLEGDILRITCSEAVRVQLISQNRSAFLHFVFPFCICLIFFKNFPCFFCNLFFCY